MTSYIAKEIRMEQEDIQIFWEDGHRSPLPHRYVRLRCRCAQCVDEMTGKELLDPDSVEEDVVAIDYFTVGNYGAQFLWSDTHHTGIYTYNFLRSICVCIECKEKASSI